MSATVAPFHQDVTTSSVLNSTLNATGNVTEDHEDNFHHQPPYIILFIFGCCGFGALLRIVLRMWSEWVSNLKCGKLMKLPYTVFLLIVGMVWGGLAVQIPSIHPTIIMTMEPDLFLHIFLPVVIFESAYVIDIHVFWRSVGHISLLAVPGLLISTMLTAVLSLIIPEIGGIENIEMKIYISLIFGSIVSATDPVAVVALLKELGNQKYLGTIIEGEALLNDGSAIVVFKIFLEMLKSATPHFYAMNALEVCGLIAQQSMLGPLMGFLSAKIASFLLQRIFNDGLAEITITLSFTYLVFFFCELFSTSGVLAVVIYGLALDRSSITPEVDHFLHDFWTMLVYLANTLIFVIVGLQVSEFMGDITLYDVMYLFLFYIGITLIRMFSIFLFFPVMQKFGVEMSWRHVLVMTWGGLRGAVSLALAIYLNSYIGILSGSYHSDVPETNPCLANNITMLSHPYNMSLSHIDDHHAEEEHLAEIEEAHDYFSKIFSKILLHTAGIVLLTLVINAATIEAVLEKLGMLEITTAQQMTMLNAVNRIQEDLRRSMGVLKFDRFLADARWSMVDSLSVVEYPYKENPHTETVVESVEYKDKNGRLAKEVVKHSASDDPTHKALFEEARLRLIKGLKMSYWKQYRNGMLTDQEARVLVSAADAAADKPGEFIDLKHIKKCWELTGFLPWAKAKLEDIQYGKKQSSIEPPSQNHHIRRIYRMVNSPWFEVVMQSLIMLNIIPISFDLALEDTWQNPDEWLLGLLITNIVFIAFYTAEVVLKFIGLGRKQYFRDGWNWFDLIILLIAYIEILIEQLVTSTSGSTTIFKFGKTTKVLKFSKITKFLRLSRMLRLSKSIIPKSINFINKLINKRLSFGYGVGKGFVTAEEDMSKLIASISDSQSIREKLSKVSIQNRLIVIRELGLLQRDHPGIAISVKTKSALRSILNQTREAIHRLCAGGVLDEIEGQLLERTVEVKLKRQTDFPAYVAPPLPQDLLKNIPWMSGDSSLTKFFIDRAVAMDYDYGDIIMEEGDDSDGIHIVIYGMIKLSGELLGQVQNVRIRGFSQNSEDDSPEVDEDKQQQEDFLSSGNIIGEMGLLTKKPRSCTVTCETAVQTFFMSATDMMEAFSKFPRLENDIWKVVAMRITAPLYYDHIQYQGFSLEEIHIHLSRGQLIELTPKNRFFRFHEGVMEVGLVYGTVKGTSAADVLTSPALIMPDHDEIKLHDCDRAVILVIPHDVTILEMVRSDTLAAKRQSSSSLMHRSSKVFPSHI